MSGTRRALLAAAAMTVAVALGAARAEETPEDLPAGEGRETAFYTCTACHGFAIVAAQGMTRQAWNQTVDDMIERNRMPPLDGAEREAVLDYLASAFPPRRRAPLNPFLRP